MMLSGRNYYERYASGQWDVLGQHHELLDLVRDLCKKVQTAGAYKPHVIRDVAARVCGWDKKPREHSTITILDIPRGKVWEFAETISKLGKVEA